QRAEVGPLDVAHRDVELAVRLAGLVDRDHVGVLDRRRHARLALEALPEPRVAGQLGGDHLHRDGPTQAHLLGAVDDAHAAAAELGLDAAAPDDRADTGIWRHESWFSTTCARS